MAGSRYNHPAHRTYRLYQISRHVCDRCSRKLHNFSKHQGCSEGHVG
ncbi:hypothetical protein PoMZ_02849 [Pyricularia oryzae]|uniref:Uncharacterized protein n=1 Tax=Pyricularia oryzae TaxID=318829 RepID=A0A4P7N8C0_PYROR|nr:hypothetical protein PoMZ_02849 [Pyricularia oryzae]